VANALLDHLALLVPQVNLETLDLTELLAKEAKQTLDLLVHLAHLVLLVNLVNLAPLVMPVDLRQALQLFLAMPDPLVTLDLRVHPDNRANQVPVAVRAHLGQKVLLVLLELLAHLAMEVHQAHLVNRVAPAKRVSVRSIAQSTVEFSSKTAQDDACKKKKAKTKRTLLLIFF